MFSLRITAIVNLTFIELTKMYWGNGYILVERQNWFSFDEWIYDEVIIFSNDAK